jgi:hypothetical protein
MIQAPDESLECGGTPISNDTKHLLHPTMLTETVSRTFLFIMLCVASASTAQEIRQSDARPSMLYFGTAAMLDDGTLALHLRLTSDGKPVNDILTYRVNDRAYDNVLRHLGGLRPGETKQFRPWKD